MKRTRAANIEQLRIHKRCFVMLCSDIHQNDGIEFKPLVKYTGSTEIPPRYTRCLDVIRFVSIQPGQRFMQL